VVLYVDSDVFGGSEQVVLQLVQGLDGTRWRPVLLHHPAPGLAPLLQLARAADCRTLAVPRVTDRNLLLRLPRLIGAISHLQPAIFHAHLNWQLSCKFGIAAAALRRTPAVLATVHLFVDALMNRNVRTQMRVVAQAVDRFLPVSRHVEGELVSEGIPAGKLGLIRNGIDPQQFQVPRDPDLRTALAGDSPAPVVLTAARLAPQKALDVLLGAAALVPEAVFLLAGEGPERPALEARAAELGISSRVRFLGARRDIAELLAISDLFVLPSLVEGLPISILEAMAGAKPVVATRIGGTDEVVVEGETGLMVPVGDTEALAAAIRRILGDPDLAWRLGQSGRTRVQREFSLAGMIAAVDATYEEMLES
jgi:glycosyltransferase involved in cell wall biosynthesis